MFKLRSSFLFLLLIAFASTPLWAESVYDANTKVELVSEVKQVKPGSEFWAALRMTHDPEWHSYWVNPGDSGMMTSIEWTLPEGVSVGEIQWPYPEQIPVFPLMGYGYSGEVLLPFKITLASSVKPGTTITLKADVDWLACEIECIPGSAALSRTLPVASEALVDPNFIEAFSEARARLPIKTGEWQFSAQADAKTLTFEIKSISESAYGLGEVYFYPYDSRLIEHAEPQPLSKVTLGHYRLTVKRSNLMKETPSEVSGVLVSSAGWRGAGSEKAIEVKLATEASSGLTLWSALLFALLGGLILNLMPCVLPVISLKVLHFAEHDHTRPEKTLLEGILYTLGVLTSFWILAVFLILLRSAGEQIGWGFHLQSPFFVVGLVFLFFAFAMNLLGVYEVWLSLTTVQNPKTSSKILAAFFSGVVTTIIATPCTAPFMGAALGFSLTQPVFVSLLVFTLLGFGMALPVLTLSLFPTLLKFVPKPGPWMGTLKKVLSLLLFATVLWLLWTVSFQVSNRALMLVVVALLLLGLALTLYGKVQREQKSKVLAWLLIGVSLCVGFIPLNLMTSSNNPSEEYVQKEGEIAWEKFSRARYEALKKEGTPFFIDFTAAWCLSCQVNERIALNRKDIVERFEELGIVALKADWTNRDPEITEMLAYYGRTSIPLYVLYGPGKKEPVLLPEILSQSIVKDALEEVFK